MDNCIRPPTRTVVPLSDSDDIDTGTTIVLDQSTRSKPLEKGRVLESLSLSSLPTPPPLLMNNIASVSKSSPNDSATMAMTPPTEDAQKIRP